MAPRALARFIDAHPFASLLGACVVLHAVAFDYSVVSEDEALYATMARVVMDGGVFYRDTVDHKPPGIVTTYAWIFSAVGDAYQRGMFAVHLVGVGFAFVTALALWGIVRRVTDERAATVAALLYATLSVAKVPYDGIAVNGELLMNLPTALAVLAVLEGGRVSAGRRVILDLIAGAMAACAVLYKYQAGLVLVAMCVLALERPRSALARVAVWAFGFLVPLGAFAVYFRAHGALADAEFWGLEFNRHYLAEGPPLLWSLGRLGAQLGGVVLPAVVLYACGMATLLRVIRRAPELTDDLPAHRAFVTTWAGLSLLAVGLGGRFFGHYFLQAELPLSVAAARPALRFFERAPRLFAGLVLGPTVFFACASLLPAREPGAWLDSPQADYLAIGQAIQRVSTPGDTIWVWGNAPKIYFTAERRAGVRFTFCNYITGLSPGTPSEYDPAFDPWKNVVTEAMGLALVDLEQKRPELIIDTAAVGMKSYGKFPLAKYPPLAAYLGVHYRRDGDAARVPLYRRID
jgi:Dolichyl-phosphate-mannose-protein mannosyltransferase